MTAKYKGHIKTTKSITLVLEDGGEETIKTIKHSDDRFAELSQCLDDKDYDALIDTLFASTAEVAKVSNGDFSAKQNRTTGKVEVYDAEGKQMPAVLAEMITELTASGVDTKPLVNFWKGKKGGARGLLANKSRNSRRQLYTFLKANNCNITADGHFIMHKGVDHNGLSKHNTQHVVRHDSESVDGKTKWKKGDVILMEHKVGKYLEIPREDCTDDPGQDCASGLHAAPWKGNHILTGGRYVELLIDPADVVSVPRHSSAGKLRACRYKITRYLGVDDKKVPMAKTVINKKVTKRTRKADKKEAVAQTGQVTVPFITDRITIPAELCSLAGIANDASVVVLHTDPRSRFLVVAASDSKTVDAVRKATLKRPEPVVSEHVKTSSKGTVSLRVRLLRLAGISGGTEYVVKHVVVDQIARTKAISYLEVRKA